MPVFKSSRKVQTFGSSLALTLPAMFVKANEVEKGSQIYVLYNLEGVLIMSKHKDHKKMLSGLNDILHKMNATSDINNDETKEQIVNE